jgi:hypothetical protein
MRERILLVEAGSSTSTVALRDMEGNYKGTQSFGE